MISLLFCYVWYHYTITTQGAGMSQNTAVIQTPDSNTANTGKYELCWLFFSNPNLCSVDLCRAVKLDQTKSNTDHFFRLATEHLLDIYRRSAVELSKELESMKPGSADIEKIQYILGVIAVNGANLELALENQNHEPSIEFAGAAVGMASELSRILRFESMPLQQIPTDFQSLKSPEHYHQFANSR